MALGALFYPKGTDENPIPFDSLFIPYIYREIYFEGIYTDVFNQKKDMIVLDIGGNCGVVTQYMRNYAKKVYTLEPSSEHFEALKKNKEFNNWDNVEIFNIAIADKDGEMEIHKNKNNLTCNSLNLDYGGDSEKIKTTTLTTFFDQQKIDEIDFCKMDIEGYEDILFRTKEFTEACKKIKSMMVEFHFPSYPELVKIMIEQGFKARRYESSAVVILFFK